uniref:Dihydropteridine reductase n=2 Tax=Ascaris TaxID=6251 RepID=A0A0M3I314_ASCLU
MSSGRIVVYGGKGALGSVIVDYFKKKNFWTLNIDLHTNDNADANVIVSGNSTWIEQEAAVLKSVDELVHGSSLDAIFCVAGGWAGGNAASGEMIKNADLMWKQSVWSSAISARIAATHLKEGGLLQLTGAAPVMEGTPNMIGYGMAKAAVQHLTKSLAKKGSGMPEGSCTLAILPTTLDTPMNRKWMPKADFSSWTSLTYISELLHEWTVNASSRPASGSLVKLITHDGHSSTSIC